MDPISALGAAGSVVGIASFGVQLSKVLIQFAIQVSSAQENLRTILEGIQATACALDQVHGFLAQECKNLEDKRHAILFSPKAINDVKSTADKCLIIFWRVEGAITNKSSNPRFEKELVERLELFNQQLCLDKRDPTLPSPDSIQLSTWRRLCWPYIAPKFDQYNSQLHSLQTNLVLIFSVISLGAQRLKLERGDEDLNSLRDLADLTPSVSNNCHGTTQYIRDKSHTARTRLVSPTRASTSKHPNPFRSSVGPFRQMSASPKPRALTPSLQKNGLTSGPVGLKSKPPGSKHPVQRETDIGGQSANKTSHPLPAEGKLNERVESDFVDASKHHPKQSPIVAQQKGSNTQQKLPAVSEHDAESSRSASRSNSSSANSLRVSFISSRLSGQDADNDGDTSSINGNFASIQPAKEPLDDEDDRERHGGPQAYFDKISGHKNHPIGPETSPNVNGGAAVKTEQDLVAAELPEADPNNTEENGTTGREYTQNWIDTDGPTVASTKHSGQPRPHVSTAPNGYKPQSSSPNQRMEAPPQRKRPTSPKGVSEVDDLSKASLERNRDTDESTNDNSERHRGNIDGSRPRNEHSSSSEQSRRLSSFVKGIFAGKESEPDTFTRCYVIKMGEVHEVPHSGALKLTDSLKRNFDSQPSHQSWYKTFAFMAAEDRDALQSTTRGIGNDPSRTIVHLKKLREKRAKFWESASPAYLAIIKDNTTDNTTTEAPFIATGARHRESAVSESFRETWGTDVPLPRATAPGGYHDMRSGATSPVHPGWERPRQESVRIQDIRAANALGEAGCLERLTTFGFFSMRKAVAPSPEATPTWERIEIIEERLSQADILQQINKLGKDSLTVAEKKLALHRFQRDQVTWLLDDLASKETDTRFRWELAQIDKLEEYVKGNRRNLGDSGSITILVFVRRIPRPELSFVHLYTDLQQARDKPRLTSRPPTPPTPPMPPSKQTQGKRATFADDLGSRHTRTRRMSQSSDESWDPVYSDEIDSLAGSYERKSTTRRSPSNTRANPTERLSRSKYDPGRRYDPNASETFTPKKYAHDPRERHNFPTAQEEEAPDAHRNPFNLQRRWSNSNHATWDREGYYPASKAPADPDLSASRSRETYATTRGYGTNTSRTPNVDSRKPPIPGDQQQRNPPLPRRYPVAPSSVDPLEDYPGYGQGYPVPQPRQYDNGFQPAYPPSSYYLPGRSGEYASPFGEPRQQQSDPRYYPARRDIAEERRIGMQSSSQMNATANGSIYNGSRQNTGREYFSYPQYYDNRPYDPMAPKANNGEYIDDSGNDIVQKLLLEWTPINGERSSSPVNVEQVDVSHDRAHDARKSTKTSEKAPSEPRGRHPSKEKPFSGPHSRRTTVDDVVDEDEERRIDSFTVESMKDSDDGKEDIEKAESKKQDDTKASGHNISDARTEVSPRPISQPRPQPQRQPSWLDPSWAQSVVDTTSSGEYAVETGHSHPASTPRFFSPPRYYGEPDDRPLTGDHSQLPRPIIRERTVEYGSPIQDDRVNMSYIRSEYGHDIIPPGPIPPFRNQQRSTTFDTSRHLPSRPNQRPLNSSSPGHFDHGW